LLEVSNSQYYYSSGNINKLTEIVSKGNHKDNSFPRNTLSDQEIEFLRLSCSEMTYKEIANSMELTPRKVDHIRDNLFEKLDMKSRVGLAMFAIKNGLITF
jgi:two-component system invasion response regulator UvrY